VVWLAVRHRRVLANLTQQEQQRKLPVDWSADELLTIDWRELDGPKVAAPSKFNFGSRRITRMLTQLNAKFEPRFPETGYCYKMKIPLDR
jgi:two-component sensor histidine kinase